MHPPDENVTSRGALRRSPAPVTTASHVLVGDGSRLVGIADDTVGLVGIADDTVGLEVSLGTRCTELTASQTAFGAAYPIDGVAVRVDPMAVEVTASVRGLEDARTIAAHDHVWGWLRRRARSKRRVVECRHLVSVIEHFRQLRRV